MKTQLYIEKLNLSHNQIQTDIILTKKKGKKFKKKKRFWSVVAELIFHSLLCTIFLKNSTIEHRIFPRNKHPKIGAWSSFCKS